MGLEDHGGGEGKFLYHSQCPHCGSSDAYAIYSSGSGYCFSCEKYDKVADGHEEETPPASPFPAKGKSGASPSGSFIKGLEFKALSARRLTEKTTRKYGYGIGVNKFGAKVQVAPYYKNRTLIAQHLRGRDKSFTWLNKPEGIELFGQHLFPSGGRRVIITEGEIDAMSIAQAFGLKEAVVSIPSGVQSATKYIKASLEWIESFDEIVLAFDDDAEGKKGIKKTAPLFTTGKVKIARYNGRKDANDLLKNEGESTVVQAIYAAEEFRPDGIVNASKLWNEVVKAPVKGYPLLYPKLSKMLGGCCKGMLFMWTAGSGIGKSTAVNEIGYHLMMKHGLKLGVVALEESLKMTVERYLGINLNRRISVERDGITDKILQCSFQETVGHGRLELYDHWGSLQGDNLLNKLRYMAVSLGVDFIILDHISIVVSGSEERDERKALDILMTKLRAMVEETGVGIHAIVHLKRTDKKFNEGGRVSLSDLRGSASLEQLSDAVIALERDQQSENPNQSTLRVLKNRRLGTTGEADTLEYDPTTGRLLPMDPSAMGNVMPKKEVCNDY